ncbi:MAG TPA: VOC family protein [Candidatus Saccharibacteria bacterium]|nr:VOC family protein [Candidatus Saccharibacteria bacterium]
MKFTHLLFWVQDNTLSEKFYKKLGFEVTLSRDDLSVVRLGELEIELVPMRDEDEFAKDSMSGEKGRGMYIYMQAADVDQTYENLKSQNIAAVAPPRDWPWGRREFVVKDPDGYKLCFWQKS